MRIRRRPPGQPLPSFLPSSDPSAPQPQPDASGDHQELHHAGAKKEELQLHHPNAAADLGDAPSPPARRAALLPLLPQGNVECSRSLGAQQQGPAPDDHPRSLQNGHHAIAELEIKAGERLANGVGRSMPVTAAAADVTKEEMKDDSSGGSGGGGGVRKRRGPAVLLEGSRCSRMNGRGWRCSQPTLVGYSLCEHHLGKGRMRSAAGGRGQLGRTEHIRKNSPAAAVAASAPKADVPPPSVPHC
ncbi:hypothetical protein ACP70R_026122 [Stipagrostis hirtigluma subsp. patula]